MAWVAWLLVGGLIAACGTVGTDGTDRKPTLTTSSDTTTYLGDVATIVVTIDDDRPDAVTLAFATDDADLLDAASVVTEGAGATRTVRAPVSWVQTGSVVLTVTATDAAGHVATTEVSIEVRMPYAGAPFTFVAFDAVADDLFGSAVALSGDTVAIGAEEVDVDADAGRGAAYLFGLTDGVPNRYTMVTASDGRAQDQFGAAIDVDGDAAIVGAYYADRTFEHQGAAYVYRRSGDLWGDQEALLPNDPATFDTFGAAVAIEGDLAAVGAPFRDGSTSNEGAVYLFSHDGHAWMQVARLTAPSGDAVAGADFGRSVAIDGGLVVVGAPGAPGGGHGRGTVYVFEGAGLSWTRVARLAPASLEDDDGFGTDVAIHDGWLAASAPYADGDGTNRGGVYVFAPNDTGWSLDASLFAVDGVDWERFGESIAWEGTTLVAGAPNHTVVESSQGAAYVFKRCGDGAWHFITRLVAPDASFGDAFAKQVDIDDGRIVAGAVFHDVDVGNEGAVYLFSR